jgi:hypothetical protein
MIEGLRGQSPWVGLGLVALPLGFMAMRFMFSLQTTRTPHWLGLVAVALGAAAANASEALQVVFASFLLGAMLYFLAFVITRWRVVLRGRPPQPR